MQTGIRDGKVTMILSYEEWMEMADIIAYVDCGEALIEQRGAYRGRISKQIIDDAKKLNISFQEMVDKELAKIPEYLKTLIRESNPPQLNKEVVK